MDIRKVQKKYASRAVSVVCVLSGVQCSMDGKKEVGLILKESEAIDQKIFINCTSRSESIKKNYTCEKGTKNTNQLFNIRFENPFS